MWVGNILTSGKRRATFAISLPIFSCNMAAALFSVADSLNLAMINYLCKPRNFTLTVCTVAMRSKKNAVFCLWFGCSLHSGRGCSRLFPECCVYLKYVKIGSCSLGNFLCCCQNSWLTQGGLCLKRAETYKSKSEIMYSACENTRCISLWPAE